MRAPIECQAGQVLSMPAGTPLEAVTAAVREWAQEHISPHTEWFAVPHADRAHPHVHVAVRAVQIARLLTVQSQMAALASATPN